jgi:hypothetical protein
VKLDLLVRRELPESETHYLWELLAQTEVLQVIITSPTCYLTKMLDSMLYKDRPIQ